MPDAQVKFFMVADAKVRAQRRFEELKGYGVEITFDEVLKNVSARDEFDSTRSNDPLRKAGDAVVIDNTNLTPDEQLQFVMNHVNKKMAAHVEA